MLNHFPYVFHASAHGRKREELPVKGVRHDARQCGLSNARRPPQDEGGENAAAYHVAEHAAWAHEMPLPYILFKRMRTHPLRKGRQHL
jgi:hypothetical protein